MRTSIEQHFRLLYVFVMESQDLYFVFADDSKQDEPKLDGAGPLVSVGGLLVPGAKLHSLNEAVNDLTEKYSCPSDEEFKWSPPKGSWMRKNLSGQQKTHFYHEIVECLESHDARTIVVVVDSSRGRATKAPTAELDAAVLFVERVENMAKAQGYHYVIVTDRPPGGRSDEDRYLFDFLVELQSGTDYVSFERSAHEVLSSPSKFSRLLQCADFVSACTLSVVAGRDRLPRALFPLLKPLFLRKGSRVAGVGLKIHPHAVYANLYHWLLGETHFEYGYNIAEYPLDQRFDQNPYAPWNGMVAAEQPPDDRD